MEKIDREGDQQRFDRVPADTREQADLKRAAHKIAWSRMNGRNDAMNPFVEPPHAPPMQQREQ
jgi:hypothetical protein